jgi:hypothetical protein
MMLLPENYAVNIPIRTHTEKEGNPDNPCVNS